MERESSKECSAFFLWRKGSFSSRNRPSRNSTLFSSRRSAWSVLKCNQGTEVFAEVSGTFCTLWPRQLRFWKGIYVFVNASETFYKFFSSALKKNYKMCPDLRWILCWILPCAQPILLARTDPRSRYFPNCFKGLTFWILNKNYQETASRSIILTLLIRKISSKHDRDYNIQAEFKLKCFSHSLRASLFTKMSGSGFGHFLIRS